MLMTLYLAQLIKNFVTNLVGSWPRDLRCK
jgi:hypothetical protein